MSEREKDAISDMLRIAEEKMEIAVKNLIATIDNDSHYHVNLQQNITI